MWPNTRDGSLVQQAPLRTKTRAVLFISHALLDGPVRDVTGAGLFGPINLEHPHTPAGSFGCMGQVENPDQPGEGHRRMQNHSTFQASIVTGAHSIAQVR